MDFKALIVNNFLFLCLTMPQKINWCFKCRRRH